ncbi:MAG: hypothetical protein AAF602_18940 [Myxococcota bacterium]
MSRATLAALALVTLTGCPEIASMTYRIDVQAKTISIVARDVRTTDPDDAEADLRSVQKTITEPDEAFSNVEGSLKEEDGLLVLYWTAQYDQLSDIDVYKHDRRAPYVWCPERSSVTKVTSPNGTVPDELHGCVVFDRKAKVLEFTVETDVSDTTSLLPQFRAAQD